MLGVLTGDAGVRPADNSVTTLRQGAGRNANGLFSLGRGGQRFRESLKRSTQKSWT